jgi:hypothetical protein
MIHAKVELKVVPLENYPSEVLRLRKPDGSDVCFQDCEEAVEFLKLYFGWSDYEIEMYWKGE